jgi:protein-tyrosine phosphatase
MSIQRVLMVCMGNICRSPMAASVLRTRLAEHGWAQQVEVDSAGTYAGHQGERADRRAVAVALTHGHASIVRERARAIQPDDFERFNLLLAMDRDNLMHLQHHCPPELAHKLHLFLPFAGVRGRQEVPDPYYGGIDGFEQVLQLCEAGARGVIDRLAGGEGGSR